MPNHVEVEEYFPLSREEIAEITELMREFCNVLGKNHPSIYHTLVAELIFSKNIR